MSRFVPHDAVTLRLLSTALVHGFRQGPFSAIVSTAARPAVARNNGCGESKPSAFAATISGPHNTLEDRTSSRVLRPNAASVRSPASAQSLPRTRLATAERAHRSPRTMAPGRRRSDWYAYKSRLLNAAANCSPSLLSGVTAAALSSAAPPARCRTARRRRPVNPRPRRRRCQQLLPVLTERAGRSAVRFGREGSGMRWLRESMSGVGELGAAACF